MAIPRVFVSSTCYDFAEVRDLLREFIKSHGFDPVLSEFGGIYFKPEEHTQESCIDEINTCHLFVLIIGGRFGGDYVADPEISIVNGEFNKAKELNIPVFTFIKKDVHADHHSYSLNIEKPELLNEWKFGSISANKNAVKIFEFIDQVRKRETGNATHTFEYAKDIVEKLKQQWAGMFYDFLQQKDINRKLEELDDTLKSISSAGNKLEETVQSFYRESLPDKAESEIKEINKRAIVRSFYNEVFDVPATIFHENLWMNIGHSTKIADAGDFLAALVQTSKDCDWIDYFANVTDALVSPSAEEIEQDDEQYQKRSLTWNNEEEYSIPATRIFLRTDDKDKIDSFNIVKTLGKDELFELLRVEPFLRKIDRHLRRADGESYIAYFDKEVSKLPNEPQDE